MSERYEFYKDEPENKVWVADQYIDDVMADGGLYFSFDKKTVLNLWTDYPQKFTAEQKAIFDKEYPYWADFFKGRTI